jgi:hypothetical protein
VDGAADSLSADEASLMLVEGDDLRVASSTRTRAGEAEAWQQRAWLGEGVAGWVAQTGSALWWDDAAFELPPEELRVLEGLAGQIAVALAREGEPAHRGHAGGWRDVHPGHSSGAAGSVATARIDP